ncbi:MAG: hypothetical protein LJE59_11800 [Chromatiaceae bacterium]|jgi:hypothetical protein|nr:hypothetical protein [Chromatiaceae bacterium]
MKHFAASIFLAILATNTTATTNVQDWWWNPALNGMGFNVGQQGDTVSVAWYLYDSSENPTFLIFFGPLVNDVVEGSLWRSYGPQPGIGYDPDNVTSEVVGTARLSFSSGNAAVFSYDYDGRSGTINLQRFSFGAQDFSGEWEYVGNNVTSGCTNPSNNGADINGGRLSISQNGNFAVVTDTDYTAGGTCTYNLTLSQKGSYYQGSGTFSCNYGVSGTAVVSDVRKTDDFLTLQYDAQATSGETCREQSKLAAVEN